MSYAIISVGGKQYRVREGERLLVDRLALEDGATFAPPVLLAGGDGGPQVAPTGVVVTAKVVGRAKGPKLVIGKYKKRTGYKRHTGFRASLTRIEIESIGAGKPRSRTNLEGTTAPAVEVPGDLPAGYAELTVAEVKAAVTGWSPTALRAALEHEQAHAKRKGAIASLESALSDGGER